MIKYENIAELSNEFIRALQNAAKNAKTEKDFDDLENIVVDTLSGLPITIVQKDWWGRQAIRERLPQELQNDTSAISHIMFGLYSHDTFAFCGKDFIENLDENLKKSVAVAKQVGKTKKAHTDGKNVFELTLDTINLVRQRIENLNFNQALDRLVGFNNDGTLFDYNLPINESLYIVGTIENDNGFPKMSDTCLYEVWQESSMLESRQVISMTEDEIKQQIDRLQ